MAAASAPKSSLYRFKDITTIPDAKDLIDIILSQTQRRTPTQVHPQFKIGRIRSFYMRKVKYCQQAYHDKFSSILTEFPRLDDIHPFYADLCNVLYDRDHYKLALGQVNTVRGIVDHIAKDYVRLLKYSDSPYKCKMLKRAALGRMCTSVRKLGDSMKYLEQVRQHLSRLPSINPNTRTLILTGYPNVGKSSFINTVTQANVEVQPYAFTTKSLFVGHFDFGYTRWQLIDTPGILDHPLANRNTIELTAITALAHIQAAVLFLVDISEQCGFSISCQVSLFHSIKTLFKNKPLVIVLNKVDVVRPENLSKENQSLIQGMTEGLTDVIVVQTSCLNAEGVDKAKNAACEILLSRRVEAKVASHRADAIANRLHVTTVTPSSRRPPNIPKSVAAARLAVTKPVVSLNRDLEEEHGGAGVFSVDLHDEWSLKNADWKHDAIPEMFAGKNVFDFIDPDIEAKLIELEREEAILLEQANKFEFDDSDWRDASAQYENLMKKIELKRVKNRMEKNHAHTVTPRTLKRPETMLSAANKLKKMGYEIDEGINPPQAYKHQTADDMVSSDGEDLDDMVDDDADDDDKETTMKKMKKKLTVLNRSRSKGLGSGAHNLAVQRAKLQNVNRLTKSSSSASLIMKADQIKRKKDRSIAMAGRAGEGDRFIGTKMPKHLFSGKRSNGKTDRR